MGKSMLVFTRVHVFLFCVCVSERERGTERESFGIIFRLYNECECITSSTGPEQQNHGASKGS